MWILIGWLRQRPADLDLQCSEKKDESEFSIGQGLRCWQDFIEYKQTNQSPSMVHEN